MAATLVWFILAKNGASAGPREWILLAVWGGGAGACGGFLVGSPILNPARIRSEGEAAIWGVLVAATSLLVFDVSLPVIAFVTREGTGGRSSIPLGHTLGESVVMLVTIVAYSFMLAGWLVLPAGAIAGIVLFELRPKCWPGASA